MGIVAATFETLPPAEDLPGRDWGVASLGPTLERYSAGRAALIALDDEDEATLPSGLVNTARGLMQQLAEAVSVFIEESSRQSYPPREESAQSFLSMVGGALDQIATEVRPQIRGDVARTAATRSEAEAALKRVQEAEQRVGELADKASVLIERVGVGELATHYSGQSKEQGEAAARWLKAVGACGLLLAGVVTWLIVETLTHSGAPDWPELGGMIATKAIALGVLSYAVSFCSKNYRSHRHLEATYRQRAAALDTYSLMASSLTEDNEGRGIILTELAKAVFAPSETGLAGGSPGDKTVIENTVPIVSAFRSAG